MATLSNTKQQSQQQYEFDSCPVLLAMIRNLTHQVNMFSENNSYFFQNDKIQFQDNEQGEQIGLVILKFFHQLYRRKSEFFTYIQTVEYLTFLTAIVFPPTQVNE